MKNYSKLDTTTKLAVITAIVAMIGLIVVSIATDTPLLPECHVNTYC